MEPSFEAERKQAILIAKENAKQQLNAEHKVDMLIKPLIKGTLKTRKEPC